MKKAIIFFITIFLSSLSLFSYSQAALKIIKASNGKVSIRDGDVFKKDYWNISPETKPDVYETLVNDKQKKVTFITDIDSISFNVRPDKIYSFIIILNNKDSAYTQINALAPPTDFTNSQISWLKKNTASFSGVKATAENGTASYSDLEAFARIVGNAHLVALGESTHGTSEFFSMKHRLLEYAVVQLGFRVFAIEDNQLQIEIINDYVLYGKGDINKVMNGMFTVWLKQEVLDMIKWMRRYNIQHPDKTVEFVGFDMQNPKLPLQKLFDFLKTKDQAFYADAEKIIENFGKNVNNAYTVSDSTKREWAKSADQLWQLVNAKKEEWLKVAANQSEKNEIAWAVQNAKSIKQCARSIYLGGQGNILYRDSAMAENISWILSQRPAGTRMIIWAHDFHISRGDDPVLINNYYSGISMGSWLSKRYGNDYRAFGLETFSGYYTAHPSYSDYSKLIQCALNPSPTGSLDKGLHQIAKERVATGLILDMRAAKATNENLDWLRKPLKVRSGNHVCIDSQYELKHSIPYQFDGIVFIDQTSGAKSLD
ncbi:MAG: erythromycin esterase family protein [Ferruginibacter sp.]